MKRSFLFSLIMLTFLFFASPVSAAQFSDVEGHWAEGYIYHVSAAGLVRGYPDGTFLPDNKISRAEFITILAQESGAVIDENTISAREFPDVGKDHWARLYILWGRENHILSGYDDGTFRPDRIVSRREMASLLYRYITNYRKAELVTVSSEIIFADDSDIGSWAKDAVYAMQRSNIINGRGNNIFDPLTGTTRAETTVMISKYLQYYRTIETDITSADIYFNGELKVQNVPVVNQNGAVMLPARTLLESAGYRVTYYVLPKLIVADRIDRDIEFWIEKTTYYSNGTMGSFQTAPALIHGMAYIALSELPFSATLGTASASESDNMNIFIGDNSSSILRKANNFNGTVSSTTKVNGSVFLGKNKIGFLGTLVGGEMNYGSYTTNNGDLFIGTWKNGMLNGAGRSVTQYGELYVGTFQNGAKSTGTTYYTDGSRFIGTWETASTGAIYPLKGQYIAADGTIYGNDSTKWSGGALTKSNW